MTCRVGFLTVGLAGALAACQSPGLSYEARLPAGNVAASTYRSVAVDGFRGPEGGWYSSRFEQMLINARLDGQPWFSVSGPGAPPGGVSGVYSGWISIDEVDVHDYTKDDTKCVEWDGLFDCETRIDIEKICYETEIEVSVTPRLVDTATGERVYSRTYHGEAEQSECFDHRVIGEDRKSHRLERGHYPGMRFGRDGDFITPELVREALDETFPAIRSDIAPRNGSARAPLMAEAVDPEAGADPAFAQAVEAARSGNVFSSCSLWEGLHASYPDAPAVTHNLGACAEASGNYERAQSLYARAVETARSPFFSGKDLGPLIESLERISERRQGETVIDALTAPGPEDTRAPSPGG